MKNPAQEQRAVTLAALRRKRAQGRPETSEIGARMSVLKEKGKVTNEEFDFVMGKRSPKET